MSSLEVNIEYIKQQTIYGLWQNSNDRTISKDINALSKQYYASPTVVVAPVISRIHTMAELPTHTVIKDLVIIPKSVPYVP